MLLGQCATQHIRSGQATVGHGVEDTQHLLVIDDDAAGLLQDVDEIGMWIANGFKAVASLEKRPDHPCPHGSGAKEGDV